MLAIDQVVDQKYTVVGELGDGGHAHVYRVRHELLGRDAALKVLQLDTQQSELRERFLIEARSIARLDDPRIVKVSDYGTLEDGRPYLILELVEGQTLAERLQQDAIPFHEAVERATEILQGLAHAHEQGIVHRDLKPQNIMVVQDGIKILDFGLARVAEAEAPEDGQVFGTPSYMAPEQATGEAVDERADLYAVGLVLHEMLTGRPVFAGSSPMETLGMQIGSAPPPLPDDLAEPWQTSALQAVIDKALRKEASERYASTSDMMRALHPLRAPTDTLERGRRIEESLAKLEDVGASRQPARAAAWAAASFVVLGLLGAAVLFAG